MSSSTVHMPTLAEDAPIVDVFPIFLGTLDVPHGSLFASDDGSTITTPLMSTLLISEGRPIVVDNGFDVEYLPKFDFRHTLSATAIDDALREHGLVAADVEIVVNTHLHSDHAGMNGAFPEARIVVQAAEYAYAFEPGADAFAYRPSTGHRTIAQDRFDGIEGNLEIAPGVWAVRTPGHTPGHQSIVVRSHSGWLAILGDACHARSIWEGEDRAALINDQEAFDHSIRVLKDSGCVPLFAHDLEWVNEEMRSQY